MTESEPDRNRDPGVPPPASTEWSQNAADEGGDTPLPPFFAGAEPPAPTPGPEPTMESVEAPEPWDTGTTVEHASADASVEDQPFPFEDMGGPAEAGYMPGEPSLPDEPITSQANAPVLGEDDILAGEEGLDEEPPGVAAFPPVEDQVDEFPVEAFHLPDRDGGLHAPDYAEELTPTPAAPDRTATRALELANRLDRLAQDLRARGTAALTDQLAGGDRFDALLTGLLAGFLAAGEE